MNNLLINGTGGFRGSRGEAIAAGRDGDAEPELFSLTLDEESMQESPQLPPGVLPQPQFTRMALPEGEVSLSPETRSPAPQGSDGPVQADPTADLPREMPSLAFRGMPVRLPAAPATSAEEGASTPQPIGMPSRAAQPEPGVSAPEPPSAPVKGERALRELFSTTPPGEGASATAKRELVPLLRLAAQQGSEPLRESREAAPEPVSLRGGPVPLPLQRPGEIQWAPLRLADPQVQWGQQLVAALKDKVELQVGQQIKQAHIRLDPPELGRLELNVRMEGDRLTVQLNAVNPAVRDALIQSMERLRSALMPHHAGGVEVNVGQGGAGQQEQTPRDQILAGRRALMEEEATASDPHGWLDTLV
ncbi:flagellar hook-length control protein FliK [Aeromonas schubertii]|uniref:flagellar hook-length control protein FliK n=1 Tax=Aeromonas schubertii TaxID=652 RepID=UPI00295E78C1|nr:flagellar hook-length control protein FliK [Aeromonas schubertii]